MLQIVMPVLTLLQESLEETQTTVQRAKPNTIWILPMMFVRHAIPHVILAPVLTPRDAQLAKRLEIMFRTVWFAEMDFIK